MTEKKLIEIIDKVENIKIKPNKKIEITKLNETIDYVRVWRKVPKPVYDWENEPYKTYLIRDLNGIYVGIVLDMDDTDLHWYIKPEYRNKRYLSSAMKETILEHLFKDGRSYQEASVNRGVIGKVNAIASEKVLINLGFTKLNEHFFRLYKKDVVLY